MLPDKRVVALYGSPSYPALGVLGEQELEQAVAQAKDLASKYESESEEPAIPSFEIITTVASADEGPTGDYSTPVNNEELEKWVTRAGEESIYVFLDLQPGYADFLSQAKMYEDLLKQPHVGLALDPEWRLESGQMHMEQVGQVHAKEINQTSQWLSELVQDNNLPQKIFMLHQFQLRMIPDRDQVKDREGLAILVHADGHGSRKEKLETYRVLTEDLPEHMYMGWKNFIDEDNPTFTPEETMELDIKPWLVSYQ